MRSVEREGGTCSDKIKGHRGRHPVPTTPSPFNLSLMSALVLRKIFQSHATSRQPFVLLASKTGMRSQLEHMVVTSLWKQIFLYLTRELKYVRFSEEIFSYSNLGLLPSKVVS